MHDPEEEETKEEEAEGEETDDEYECILCDKVFSYLPKRCECGNHTFNKIREPVDDGTEDFLPL